MWQEAGWDVNTGSFAARVGRGRLVRFHGGGAMAMLERSG
jgi:hypothetical protein